MRIAKVGSFLGLMLVFFGCPAVQGDVEKPTIRVGSFQPEVAIDQQRLQVLGVAVGFEAWPAPRELFVGPSLGRHLLASPGLITHEVRACDSIRFGELPWGRCEWSWRRLGDDGDPESRTGTALEGDLDVKVALAPGSRAAQEYLLVSMADNMLPIDGLAVTWTTAGPPDGLGDVAFLLRSRQGDDVQLKFTRGNVAVHVRGSGVFAAEVEPLALRIDTQILDQRPLTADQLLARRPTVVISTDAVGRDGVPFSVSELQGREVVVVRAMVDGQQASAANGIVFPGSRKGAVQTEVVVITDDLLAGSSRESVTISD